MKKLVFLFSLFAILALNVNSDVVKKEQPTKSIQVATDEPVYPKVAKPFFRA